MVAMICPEKAGDKLSRLFHNQYMTTSGKWATDFDHKASCRTDKVEILDYCKKVRVIRILGRTPFPDFAGATFSNSIRKCEKTLPINFFPASMSLL